MTWANSGYKFRKKITINYSLVGGDEVNFPVVLSITDTHLKDVNNGGYVKSSSGYDIVFYDSTEKVLLYHEIESYTSSTGVVIFWICIPSLSSTSNTVFYMYFGKEGVTADPSSTSTWDLNFIMVNHLIGSAAATCLDSTTNNNDVTGSGGTPLYQQAGKIGYCVYLDSASSEYLSVGDSPSLDINATITLEGWVNISELGATSAGYIIGKIDSTANKRAYTLWYYESDDRLYGYVYEAGTTVGEYSRCADPISKSVWVYVTFTAPTGTNKVTTLYMNGVDQTPYAVVTSTADSIYVSDRPLYIGCSEASGTPANFFKGYIDEARISNIARSANWVETTYNTTNSPSTFLSLGILEVIIFKEAFLETKKYKTDVYIDINKEGTENRLTTLSYA